MRAAILAILLVALLAGWQARALLDERWPAELQGAERELDGRIASLPERQGEDWRFLFEPLEPGYPRLIRVGWYRADQAVRAGECWRLALKLRTPHGSLNPGGSDYELWLFRQGIGATATVRAATRCGSAARDRVLEWRQRIADAIRAALPDHPAAGLVVALTVGDESAVSAADWDLFRLTGTSHLVAISGFNIAIVAGFAFVLGRRLWTLWPSLCLRVPAPRAGLLVSALAGGGYAMLAGFGPPVQRAVLMLWIGLAALWAHRVSRPGRVLVVAWIAVLLLDPFAALSPGLWLSFGAVAAIFYVSLYRLRAPGFWHGAVTLQWLLAVALAPLSLGFFHGISWIAPFVNLLAVPFFTVLTPWALLAVVLLPWPAIGGPLLAGAAFALELFREALAFAAQLPDLWLPASPSLAAVLLALAGVALLFAPRGLPLRPLGLLCLAPLLVPQVTPPRGNPEITVLDVGQGLAVVVRTTTHTLLFDAGPAFEDGFDAGEAVVAPFLLGAGIHRLDRLVLSHADLDHRGGVPAVERLLRVERETGTDGHEECREGERWDWDGVEFQMLNGPAPGRSRNNGGCVLLVRAPAFSVLLPADVEAATESRLVARYGSRLRADALVAPHHGSRTSSTEGFVRAVQPRVVVFSAGWRNHFGHPRPQVVARYAALGVAAHVTGSEGAITLWRDPESGRIETREYRREAARPWNAAPGP